jgi:hypothetical protein
LKQKYLSGCKKIAIPHLLLSSETNQHHNSLLGAIPGTGFITAKYLDFVILVFV